MTLRTNQNTRAVAWGCLWSQLERYGIPTDPDEALDWDQRHGNYGRAKCLLDTLCLLNEARMSPATISLLADAVLYAFKLGCEYDGPPSTDIRDATLIVVRDLIERHQIKPTDV